MKGSFSWAKCQGFRKTDGRQADLFDSRVEMVFLKTRTWGERGWQRRILSTVRAPSLTQDTRALGIGVLTDAGGPGELCAREIAGSLGTSAGGRRGPAGASLPRPFWVGPLSGKQATPAPSASQTAAFILRAVQDRLPVPLQPGAPAVGGTNCWVPGTPGRWPGAARRARAARQGEGA